MSLRRNIGAGLQKFTLGLIFSLLSYACSLVTLESEYMYSSNKDLHCTGHSSLVAESH